MNCCQQRASSIAILSIMVSMAVGGCIGLGKPNSAKEHSVTQIRAGAAATAPLGNSGNRQARTVPRATFELPFLGTIHCRVSWESVDVTSTGAGKIILPFRVFKDERGDFLRAEFMKKNARNYEATARDLAEGMKARDQQIVALAGTAPRVSWQTVIKTVADEVEIRKVTRLTLTSVDYRLWDQPVEPLFIAHVFGVPIFGDRGIGGGREEALRMRFLLNQRGEIMRFDNCL
jgi:hypothetical protein